MDICCWNQTKIILGFPFPQIEWACNSHRYIFLQTVLLFVYTSLLARFYNSWLAAHYETVVYFAYLHGI